MFPRQHRANQRHFRIRPSHRYLHVAGKAPIHPQSPRKHRMAAIIHAIWNAIQQTAQIYRKIQHRSTKNKNYMA